MSLLEKVIALGNLKKAWNHVYQNGLGSDSEITRKKVITFKKNEEHNFQDLHNHLLNETFEFKNVKSSLITKGDGKTKRPIADIPVDSRIVQRSILNILQEHPNIKNYLAIPTSFGAIEKKGVPEAIKAAKEAINKGQTYYFKSDIKDFFKKISISKVLEEIGIAINDKKFMDFLEKAIRLKVKVLSDHREYYRDFDYSNQGVPQGCSLSPLFGNIILSEFDEKMNEPGVTCLRYLDDFIIFAPNKKVANAVFAKGRRILSPLGLDAYDPEPGSTKAQRGNAKRRFEYLGIEFDRDLIRPSKRTKDKLLNNLKTILEESKSANFGLSKKQEAKESVKGKKTKKAVGYYSLHASLNRCNQKIEGWGKQYIFCNNKEFMGSVDVDIDRIIKNYIIEFLKYINNKKKDKNFKLRRAFGIHHLTQYYS